MALNVLDEINEHAVLDIYRNTDFTVTLYMICDIQCDIQIYTGEKVNTNKHTVVNKLIYT